MRELAKLPELAMKTHQDFAKGLLRQRLEGVSIRRSIRKAAPRYAVMAIVGVVLLSGARHEEGRMKLLFTAGFGMYCGVLLSDIARFRRLQENWRFTEQIIDWQKVEALSQGNSPELQPSIVEAANISNSSSAVVTGSPERPPSDLTLPQLLVAGLGFLPILGLPFALGAFVWGLLRLKTQRGAMLVLLGASGAVLSSAVILVFVFLPILLGGLLDKYGPTNLLLQFLTATGVEIEAFHKATGHYPARLSEMAQSPRYLVVYDFLQPPQIIGGYSTQPTFYYQRLNEPPGYYLFSVGVDGKPFTPDDVLPTASPSLPGLRLATRPPSSQPGVP